MIRSGRSHLITLFAMLALSAALSGCLTTIDDSCEAIARAQCASCFSCAESIEDAPDKLCELPASAAESRAKCEAALEKQCASQANAVQDPYKDLERCEDALDADTCADLAERSALGQPDAPSACLRFL